MTEDYLDIRSFLQRERDLTVNHLVADIREKVASGVIQLQHTVNVFVHELIPTDDTVRRGRLLDIARIVQQQEEPILVVDFRQRLYIADGHHRVCVAAWKHRTTLRAHVVRVEFQRVML